MIVATTENLPGHRVTRVIGQVFGLTVRTRGLGGNIAAKFRGLVGGEVASYTKLLEDARRQAVDRLVETATAAGANAVVSVNESVVFNNASGWNGPAASIFSSGNNVVLANGANQGPQPTFPLR